MFKDTAVMESGFAAAEDGKVRNWLILPDGAWGVEVEDMDGNVAKLELEMGVRRVKDWTCNCRDGASGIPCQHLAAAVYAYALADGKPQATELPASQATGKASVSQEYDDDELDDEMPVEKDAPKKRGRKPTGRAAKREEAVAKTVASKQAAKLKKSSNPFEALLESLSKEDLVKFIIHQSKRNKLFINEVQLYFADRASDAFEGNYETMVLDTLKTIRARSFEYPAEYEHLPTYKTAMKLMSKIMKRGQQLFDENNFSEAFQLAKGVIKAGLSSDNYRQLLYDDIGTSLRLIRSISENVQSFTMKDEIFDYLTKEIPKYPGFDQIDYQSIVRLVDNMLIDSGKIAFYKNLLTKLIASDKSGYYSVEWIEKLVKLEPNQEENIYLQHKKNDRVLEKLVLFYQSKKRFSEAKALLVERMETMGTKPKTDYDFMYAGGGYMMVQNRYSPSKWQDLMLEVLEKEENWSEIKQILKNYFQKDFAKSDYKLYKKAYLKTEPEKWPDVARAIMQKTTVLLNLRIQIAAEENFLEDLLKYIAKGDFSTQGAIDKYFTVLFPQYPKESLELLRKRIDVLSKETRNEHYEMIQELLLLMGQKGGAEGKKLALQTTDEYLEKYSIRRNMKALLLQVKQKLK